MDIVANVERVHDQSGSKVNVFGIGGFNKSQGRYYGGHEMDKVKACGSPFGNQVA